MDDLEMCKAFAKLEGISVCMIGNIECLENLSRLQDGSAYNPITDLALNCKARDDYGAYIDYGVYFVCCKNTSYVEFDNKEDIPRAVIECILKSKGK